MPSDEDYLRLTLDIAREARSAGNHPFGAILVGPDGVVLMQAGNSHSAAGDRTAHAERVLMTQASMAHPASFLAACTLYSSAEPCAMCAGAAYWAGIGRVVYGLSEDDLRALIGPHPENLTMNLQPDDEPALPRCSRRRAAVRQRRRPAAGSRITGRARRILDVARAPSGLKIGHPIKN